ncbi:MAG: sulfurtransferase [Acidimicrobiales bacterium]|nr:sulfurtransferase [Hyphomonadaceae bacterium]RZV40611.1 MAG: sulfurtransferase [Acidimicrobiales bacterium]
MKPNDPMVAVTWLADNIHNPNVLVVDTTWCMPGDIEPYPNTYIEGVRFDIDEIADQSAGFSHTLPTPEHFEYAVRNLGVNNDTHVICYDRHGLFSAPRAWWMFRVMGHEKVNVLDGGLPAWVKAGQATVAAYKSLDKGTFEATFQPNLYRDTNEMRDTLYKGTILDARPSGRFNGTAPEPRAGLNSGHMPSSTNVPFSELKTSDGYLKRAVDLCDVFMTRQIELNKPIITTCGSGITACGIALALARLGSWDTAVYDGSWTEWASTDNCPIDKV